MELGSPFCTVLGSSYSIWDRDRGTNMSLISLAWLQLQLWQQLWLLHMSQSTLHWAAAVGIDTNMSMISLAQTTWPWLQPWLLLQHLHFGMLLAVCQSWNLVYHMLVSSCSRDWDRGSRMSPTRHRLSKQPGNELPGAALAQLQLCFVGRNLLL